MGFSQNMFVNLKNLAFFLKIIAVIHIQSCICINCTKALECQDAFGMESGAITDGQISASSEHSARLAAIRGRLNVQHSPGKGGSWAAQYLDQNQWLQIDVGSQYTKVTCVATQGRSDHPQWVTKYMLQYSNSGGNFHDYRQQYHTTYKVNTLNSLNNLKLFFVRMTVSFNERTNLSLVHSELLCYICLVWYHIFKEPITTYPLEKFVLNLQLYMEKYY